MNPAVVNIIRTVTRLNTFRTAIYIFHSLVCPGLLGQVSRLGMKLLNEISPGLSSCDAWASDLHLSLGAPLSERRM